MRMPEPGGLALRTRRSIRSWWPDGAAGRVLLALLAVGIVLRLIAIASLWPTTDNVADNYHLYSGNPFEDPLHPAGYGLILAGLGHISQSVVLPVLIQHLCGICSALLFFAATRRISGSAWAGLLPAGIVLLNPDQIFLEHAVMSETWAVLACAGGLYAAMRATELSASRLRWAVLAGVVLGLAVTIRTAALPMIPVVAVAVWLSVPSPLRQWRTSLPAPAALAAGAAVIVILYATANSAFGPRFGIGPSPGWYLYGRVAQFADCSKFDPPPGTEALCDSRPPSERPGSRTFMFDVNAAAPRAFGGFGQHDELVGEWANRALRAQPGDFASLAWRYLRAYWLPSTRPEADDFGLDPQLDFSLERPEIAGFIHPSLEVFYDEFTVHRFEPGLYLLRGVQRVTRFGATLLSITTVLVFVGLFIGDRRSRIGIVMFGLGGLALIIAPALTGAYVGRYTLPMAAPLMAAAGITLVSLRRGWLRRRGATPRGSVPAWLSPSSVCHRRAERDSATSTFSCDIARAVSRGVRVGGGR